MHTNIVKVEINHDRLGLGDGTPNLRSMELKILSADPWAVLRAIEEALEKTDAASATYPAKPAAPSPRRDPLADATRPAGTPAGPERRSLEDAAAATGGVVTHAAGGIPTVVPRGEEPTGLPADPPAPPAAPDATPAELQKGDAVVFALSGDQYTLADGSPCPEALQTLLREAGGRLVVAKVNKRKDCLIALVEGSWAVKLVNGAVAEVKPPTVQPRAAAATPAAAPSAPPKAEPATPATEGSITGQAASDDPAVAASVATAKGMLPKLQAADGVRGVMEELLAAGVPRRHMYGVLVAVKEDVPCVKKQAALKDRVPRLLMIIGQDA